MQKIGNPLIFRHVTGGGGQPPHHPHQDFRKLNRESGTLRNLVQR